MPEINNTLFDLEQYAQMSPQEQLKITRQLQQQVEESEHRHLKRDKYARLNSIYKIVDKEGKAVTFNFNKEQNKIWEQCFDTVAQKLKCNPNILKARQLGITTFFCLLYLDDALTIPNINCYIQSHEQQSIDKIFRVVRFAYDNLPDWIKPELDRGGGSKHELYFPKLNSRIYVGLENRSNTIHRLHLSEVAFQDVTRIAATMGALPPNTFYSKETTPNGLNWYYKDWINSSNHNQYKNLFFSWFEREEYQSLYPIDTSTFTKEEQDLIDKYKLSFRQISFRREKIAQLHSANAFNQEYPSDDVTCFHAVSADRLVIPEATQLNTWIAESELPEFYFPVTYSDLGFVDHFATVTGYYDFKRDKIVVLDELLLNYSNTKTLCEKTIELEKKYWKVEPRRKADNDLQQLYDMKSLYNFSVSPIIKKTKTQSIYGWRDSVINNLRVLITEGKLEVNPRCIETIKQLKFGVWNEKRTDLERSEEYGHLDLLMALAYMAYDIDKTNPYPVLPVGITHNTHYIKPELEKKASTNNFKKMVGLK